MAMSRSLGGTSLTTRSPMLDVAGADRLEPGDHPERRGLAAARGPDEHDELLVADLQVDVFDGVHDVVELVDVFQDYLCYTLSDSEYPARTQNARGILEEF